MFKLGGFAKVVLRELSAPRSRFKRRCSAVGDTPLFSSARTLLSSLVCSGSGSCGVLRFIRSLPSQVDCIGSFPFERLSWGSFRVLLGFLHSELAAKASLRRPLSLSLATHSPSGVSHLTISGIMCPIISLYSILTSRTTSFMALLSVLAPSPRPSTEPGPSFQRSVLQLL